MKWRIGDSYSQEGEKGRTGKRPFLEPKEKEHQ